MSNDIFDTSKYESVDAFVRKHKRKKVKCQHHDDKHPSAVVNDTKAYCYVCGKAFFFFKDIEKGKEYKNNKEKAEEYHECLKNSTDDSLIKKYIKQRGISNYIVGEFCLGCDEARNQLVLPIKNTYGNVTGFGFRKINDTDTQKPKYINSENRGVFKKCNNLYGIDKITDKCGHLILCEGYICVLSAFKKGFKENVCFVALMGTALAENHLPLLLHIKKKRLENANYKLLGNKDGEYAWRMYELINPILYIRLVNVIFTKNTITHLIITYYNQLYPSGLCNALKYYTILPIQIQVLIQA